VKGQINSGRPREIYYFRDQQGLEVDFLVPRGAGRIALIEAKASATVRPEMADSLARLAQAVRGHEVASYVVHNPPRNETPMTTLRPGVRAVSLEVFLVTLSAS